MNNLSNTPLLSLKNVKTYFFQDEGTVKAVDGVTFDVYKGRTLGIVGESGCGKSVTARSILNLIEKPGKIVEGEIIYKFNYQSEKETELNIAILDSKDKDLRSIRGNEISMIFQEPMTSFSPVHTIGFQIIEAVLLHNEMNKNEAFQLGVDMLRQVGIPLPEQRMNEYPHQLSGGLRQRAMIAMALVCNPNILVADEPTTAIDVTTQAQILELIENLQFQSGMAIIFITHNLGVIAEIADEVIVMYLGRIVEKASVDDFFNNPMHPYSQALMRSIPTIDSIPKNKFPTISGAIPHPHNRPTGCTFHPRCEHFLTNICEINSPALIEVEPDHEVSCFLYEKDVEKTTYTNN